MHEGTLISKVWSNPGFESSAFCVQFWWSWGNYKFSRVSVLVRHLWPEGWSMLSLQDKSPCFCFLALMPSPSRAFNLFLIAAILELRLICPELLAERLVLVASPARLEGFSASSTEYFSLERRTTNGRPQASLPCIFSLANFASCMLTLMVEIRNCFELWGVNNKETYVPLYCYTGWKQSLEALHVSGHEYATKIPRVWSSQTEKTSWVEQP